MTYIIGLEHGQLHVRTPQNDVYFVGIHNEPSLEQIFKRHGLPEFCEFSRSVDSPEKNGVPKDYNAREVILRVAENMGMAVPAQSLSKLFDECLLDRARLQEAQGKDPLMSEIREVALAEFIRRVSIEQGMRATKPAHMKQDTPPEQAVAIIAGIEGWLSNLVDGCKPKLVVAGAQKGLEDLKILCGAQRGQPEGWLRKTW